MLFRNSQNIEYFVENFIIVQVNKNKGNLVIGCERGAAKFRAIMTKLELDDQNST